MIRYRAVRQRVLRLIKNFKGLTIGTRTVVAIMIVSPNLLLVT